MSQGSMFAYSILSDLLSLKNHWVKVSHRIWEVHNQTPLWSEEFFFLKKLETIHHQNFKHSSKLKYSRFISRQQTKTWKILFTFTEVWLRKRLHYDPGNSVFSDSGHYIENKYFFFEHHLEPVTSQKVKAFGKNTVTFFKNYMFFLHSQRSPVFGFFTKKDRWEYRKD